MIDRQFSTPVLFLIFNRPDTTQQVFEQIRKVKPTKLFVAADGPRPTVTTDEEKCQQAREIIKQIDWECDLQTRFHENNVGCKIAVSSAIDWFFVHVNEGIILEDDCLPNESFFSFCKELLEFYRSDERIMHIGGTNLQNGIVRSDGSYYFSRYNHIWGWATWKRAWKYYDVAMENYPAFKNQKKIFSLLNDREMVKHWIANFDAVYYHHKNTWDHQWTYSIWCNNGLCIIPNINLVSNIGFREDATHTIEQYHAVANMKSYSLNKMHHPSFIIPHLEADRYSFRKYFYLSFFQKIMKKILSPVRSLQL